MDNIFNRKKKDVLNPYKTQVIPKGAVIKKSVPKVCLNCNSIYEISPWDIEDGKPTGISHGLCKGCYKKLKEKIEKDVEEERKTQKKGE